ncbi:hypothetical protein E3E31_11340 [Thermococcus sp. M39]|uniref:hypothetical protein n=1 Tax=unclassified Thermococcus TaxID=2627626 RepID=UPI00143A9846|nr:MULTISPECIES: hypothetical protein [unclassified Thermococcus]NJE09106.1 hypothetical protein [Thermococcus sp. M39]NJE12055.1 hypothetical protein [Thermococcus sp. LS2]
MQLPKMQPFKENVVSTSKEDFISLVREALSNGSGTFIKIFTKDSSEKYYFTMLTDNSKILATYGKLLTANRDVVGKEALDVLQKLLSNPMVIDVYILDEITLKLSIADNIEIYSNTPKIDIDEFLGIPRREELSEVLEKEKLLEQVLEKVKREEIKPVPQIEKIKDVKTPTEKEEKLEEKRLIEAPKQIPKPAPKKEGPKVKIEIIGSNVFKSALEEAFKEYSETLFNDIRKMGDVTLGNIEIHGEIGTGVVYLTIQLNANIDNEKKAEIAKRKILFFANRHVPIIGRVSGLKPIIRSVKVNVIAGEKVESMEEREREEVELWRLKKPPTVQISPKLFLTVDPEFRSYFSAYARTLLKDIEEAGIRVDKMEVEVEGRKEHEINITLQTQSSNLSKAQIEAVVTSLAKEHAREMGRALRKYVWVHKVEVELSEAPAVKPKQRKLETVINAPKNVDPYLRKFVRDFVSEIKKMGIEPSRVQIDAKEVLFALGGGRAYHITVTVEGASTSGLPLSKLKDMIEIEANKRARELVEALGEQVIVREVKLNLEESASEAPATPAQVSDKAAEILKKKALLEKEVEKLLREAGIEELSFLTEDKKKEAEKTLLKSRVEPAMEALKSKVQSELKLLPRVTFKWLKMNWNFTGSNVEVSFEASLSKEEVGGLFGAFSGISDDKIKEDAIEIIQKAMRDVSREYGISIVPKKINILVR